MADNPLEFLDSLVKLYLLQHEEYSQIFTDIVNSFESYTNRNINEIEALHLAGLVHDKIT